MWLQIKAVQNQEGTCVSFMKQYTFPSDRNVISSICISSSFMVESRQKTINVGKGSHETQTKEEKIFPLFVRCHRGGYIGIIFIMPQMY